MTDPFTQVESVNRKQDIENHRISDAHKPRGKVRLRSNVTSSDITEGFDPLCQCDGK
jgi:hypothetical protein